MPVAIFVIHNLFVFIQRYSGNFKVENFCEYLWSKGNGLLVAVRGKQKQVDHLRNEVEELKHQLDSERAKNDTCTPGRPVGHQMPRCGSAGSTAL